MRSRLALQDGEGALMERGSRTAGRYERLRDEDVLATQHMYDQSNDLWTTYLLMPLLIHGACVPLGKRKNDNDIGQQL